MALKGDLTWTFIDHSETETEEIVTERPDGTEVIIEQQKQTMRSESYSDVYLYVKSIQVHTFTIEGEKKEHVFYHFAGYTSKETRDADNEDFLFFDTGMVRDYDCNRNLWSQCYNSLKLREDLSELEDC